MSTQLTSKSQLVLATIAAVCLSVAMATAQTGYQIGYFTNTQPSGPDPTVFIANAGLNLASQCAMIYVVSVDQSMPACCGCVVGANSVLRLQLQNNLFSQLVGPQPLYGQIKVVSSVYKGGACDPTAAVTPAPGLRAWSTHIQDRQTVIRIEDLVFGATYPITETQFSDFPADAGLVASLESQCASAASRCTCQ